VFYNCFVTIQRYGIYLTYPNNLKNKINTVLKWYNSKKGTTVTEVPYNLKTKNAVYNENKHEKPFN
tara:strand:+ start:112 stop:309 length:198 start_codon:yes stop_codon:yes gene_type:complete